MINKDKNNIARFDNIYEIFQEEIVKNYPSIYEMVIDTAIRARFLFKDLYRVDDIEEPFLMKKTEPIEKPTYLAIKQICLKLAGDLEDSEK